MRRKPQTPLSGRCVPLLAAGASAVWAGPVTHVPAYAAWTLLGIVPLLAAGLVWLGIRNARQRKRFEAELANVKAAVVASSEGKSDLLASISHEIRTPLNSILGMSDLALGTRPAAELQEYLISIKSAADSLLTVLTDVFDYSHMESGGLVLEPADFSLRDSIADPVQLLARSAQERGLLLTCDIGPDVPDSLHGDAARLRQILIHLIGNSVKYTESGQVRVNVARESCAGGEIVLHFTVADTGCGIPADKLLTIFDEFDQAHRSHAGRFGGPGLGLAIARKLVSLMRGRIWVESPWLDRPPDARGQGSVFRFTAQFGPGHDQRPVGIEKLHDTPVLIVDNAPDRAFLAQTLRTWGLEAEVASDHSAASGMLDRLRQKGDDPPVVILGVAGSDEGDRARVEWFRQNAGDVRIVALMADASREDELKFGDTRVDACLLRPVKLSALATALVSLAGQRPVRGAARTGSGARNPSRRLRILVAEDNRVNQKLATKLLERRGHYVVAAKDGIEAVDALERQCFDLVLMDVQMPGMDGIEATRTIRAREKAFGSHMPIIAMTAHAMKGDRERCIEAGMDGYISKPIQADELYALAESVGFGGDGNPPNTPT